jgi:hypothetical protein
MNWSNNYRAHAVAELMEIWLLRIRSALTYAAALHELGHCLGRYQTSQSGMVAERWALALGQRRMPWSGLLPWSET